MTNATRDFYTSLSERSKLVIDRSTEDPARFGRAHQTIDELSAWTKFQCFGPENIAMVSGLSEATSGLYMLASGCYRSAFRALRLFLELSLASIHFSANRLELAEWVAGRKDIIWSDLADSESGVLSIRYSRAFFPDLKDEVAGLNANVRQTYRALSEYVHGNRLTLGTMMEQIAFSPEVTDFWFKSFDMASESVLAALCLRFLKELKPSELSAVAVATRESIGHFAPIRTFLEGQGK